MLMVSITNSGQGSAIEFIEVVANVRVADPQICRLLDTPLGKSIGCGARPDSLGPAVGDGAFEIWRKTASSGTRTGNSIYSVGTLGGTGGDGHFQGHGPISCV